jgi:hypothetical protein
MKDAEKERKLHTYERWIVSTVIGFGISESIK